MQETPHYNPWDWEYYSSPTPAPRPAPQPRLPFTPRHQYQARWPSHTQSNPQFFPHSHHGYMRYETPSPKVSHKKLPNSRQALQARRPLFHLGRGRKGRPPTKSVLPMILPNGRGRGKTPSIQASIPPPQRRGPFRKYRRPATKTATETSPAAKKPTTPACKKNVSSKVTASKAKPEKGCESCACGCCMLFSLKISFSY